MKRVLVLLVCMAVLAVGVMPACAQSKKAASPITTLSVKGVDHNMYYVDLYSPVYAKNKKRFELNNWGLNIKPNIDGSAAEVTYKVRKVSAPAKILSSGSLGEFSGQDSDAISVSGYIHFEEKLNKGFFDVLRAHSQETYLAGYDYYVVNKQGQLKGILTGNEGIETDKDSLHLTNKENVMIFGGSYRGGWGCKICSFDINKCTVTVLEKKWFEDTTEYEVDGDSEQGIAYAKQLKQKYGTAVGNIYAN